MWPRLCSPVLDAWRTHSPLPLTSALRSPSLARTLRTAMAAASSSLPVVVLPPSSASQPPPLPLPCLAPSHVPARPSYWPSEQRCRLTAWLHAAGVCGQGATAHLWLSCEHPRVRTRPLVLRRHSPAASVAPFVGTTSSRRHPLCKSRPGASHKNLKKGWDLTANRRLI
jgi:hypothetical protein